MKKEYDRKAMDESIRALQSAIHRVKSAENGLAAAKADLARRENRAVAEIFANDRFDLLQIDKGALEAYIEEFLS